MDMGMGMGMGMENMMMVVVVEYLGESMSTELLCKFPDNSAFDFDYSQSAIWSPLPNFLIQRKLAYDEEDDHDHHHDHHHHHHEEGGLLLVNTLKQMTLNLKKKIATGAYVFHCKINKQKKKKKKDAFDFSPSPVSTKRTSSSPSPRKGWSKLLKVASNRFKKATKKKDPMAHIKLSYPIV